MANVNVTPNDLAEFTEDDSNPEPPNYADMTAAERQVLTLQKLDHLATKFDAYDELIGSGIEQIQGVLQAAENNPMIRNMLGL